MPRQLPDGVQQGTYTIRATNDGEIEIDVREFVGWWDTEQNNFVRRVRNADPDVIRLSIASEGGFVADALGIHDFLKGHRARVEVQITGMTASAATIIAMAGDQITMSDNALFLVHHASGIAWGKVEDLESAAGGLHKINGRILNIYAKRTGQSEDDLDRLMSEEEWLTAEETLEWGFIDEIFEPAPEDDEDESATAHRLSAVAHALGLPPLPTKRTATDMAGKNKESAEQKAEAEAKAAQEAAEAAEAAKVAEQREKPEQRDERDELATMKAELASMKAENARLAEERRQSALSGLRETLTGRVPGKAVEDIVEAADKATNGEEVDVIAALTAAAKSIPEIVSRGPVDVTPPDAEAAEARRKAVAKM